MSNSLALSPRRRSTPLHGNSSFASDLTRRYGEGDTASTLAGVSLDVPKAS